MTCAKLAAAACAFALVALAEPAGATIWTADCNAGTISNGVSTVASGLMASNTLGFTLLGTPNEPGQLTPGPVSGDTIEIRGLCTEDVTIRIPGLTLLDADDPGMLDTSDGIQGQLELAGAGNTVVDGILLTAPGTFSQGEVANLYVHDGASLALKNAEVSGGPLIGIDAARSSAVSIQDTTVSGNGSMGPDDTANMGILATSNATVYLGKTDGTAPATVQNNTGAGIVAADSSSISIFGATIAGNGLPQVWLLGSSSGFITGNDTNSTTITAPSGGCCQAIFAAGASTLDIEQGASVIGNQNKAAIALSASTLLLQGSVVSSGAGAPTPAESEPTLHGTGNSVIALAGGNTVCFGTPSGSPPCNALDGGIAIDVDHVSTLTQVANTILGYPAAPDTVLGGGSVQMQSTADLGKGLVGGMPSVAWTTGSLGFTIKQNSSFRLQGGATIVGTLNLTQSSNAFFNKSNGGTNTISGGIICPFITVPAAYVAGPANVSPEPVLATSFQSASKTLEQCLPF